MTLALRIVTLQFEILLLPSCPGQISFAASRLAHWPFKGGGETFGLSGCERNDMSLAGITTIISTGAAMRMDGVE